ncbi:MAG: ABC transporter permease [Phycisphaerae bacterium]|nr:ABC transporter permease [Phycisphaerae bacterium]
MMLTRYMFREVRRRPGRTVLTLLGIVIGVQSLVAIPLTIQTTRRAHHELFEGLTGKAALEVVPCGQGGFSADLATQLEALPDVRAAVPVIQSTAMIITRSGAVPMMTLGVDTRRNDQTCDYVLRSGSLPADDGQALLEASFARSQRIDLGTTVRLLTPSGTAELQVAGLLEPVGAVVVNGGAVAIMPLTTAQQLYRLDGQVNNLNLVLAEGADSDQVALEVSKCLPPGLTVQTPAARAALALEGLGGTEKLLAVLSVVSLVAGAFVILNSFLMSIGERRRALAILRSLGATRKQVTRLLYSEAAALGVVGTAVGIPVGLAAAFVMTHLMAQMSGSVVPQLHLTAGPFVLAGVLGPGVALLATYLPARAAGRRSPLAELRDRPGASPARDARARRWPSFIGFGLLATVVVSFTVIFARWLPHETYIVLLPVTLVALLVGVVLVIPVALSPLSRLVERLLRPILGIEASLAIRQLRRHPTRTALVVGVLTISVMLSTGFGNAMLNAIRDTRAYVARVMTDVDFLVTPTAFSRSVLMPVSMPEEYADRIGEIEGVRRVGKGRILSSQAAGHRVMIFPRSCKPGEDPGLLIVNGVEAEVQQGLRRGEVVLGTTLAQRSGLGRGDEISIETRTGPRSFTIAGLAVDYSSGGMSAFIEWDHAKRLFNMEGAQYLYVVADPEDRAAVAKRLRAFCDEHSLQMHSREGFISTVDEMMAGVLGSAWVLMALVFVVASLGITNFLTMNVLEQTRELGILRAIAMKRRQVYRMILSEAWAMGVISAIPGVLLGVLLGYAVSHSHYAIVGVKVPYVFEPALIVGCVAVALVVAVLASLPPARRAGRLTIIRALQYE